MALVTEASLREKYGDVDRLPTDRFEVPQGTVVTPSARSWLIDRRVDLVIGGKVVFATARPSAAGEGDRGSAAPAVPARDGAVSSAAVESAPVRPSAQPTPSALPAFTKPERFDVIDGSQLPEKPEHLTALRGNLLVPKDHPEIRFRGQLDSLEADIIVTQTVFARLGLTVGVADLGEMLRFVKQILRAEVLDLPLEQINLLGLDDAQLRHRSHYPQEYYGMPHFAASVDDGEAVALLNRLRTRVREVELAAFTAYSTGGTDAPSRPDLIQALNRLSSACYLMMFKAKCKEYDQ